MSNEYRIEEEELKERYELMKERVVSLCENADECSDYSAFVQTTANFLKQIYDVYEKMVEIPREQIGKEQLLFYHDVLREDVKEENYQHSFANPVYAVAQFGTELGQKLCYLYSRIRSLISCAYESKLFHIVVYSELFVEIETILENRDQDNLELVISEVQDAIYAFEKDYVEVFETMRIEESLNPKHDFYTKIVMECDLSDDTYLYYYGMHVGENEIQSAKYLNSLSQDEIDAMAFTYTDGYREGFEIAGIDLSAKKTVNIRYHIGFERMVKAAILQFAKLGLEPILNATSTHTTSVNKQYNYDHRLDAALYLDTAYVNRRIEVVKAAYEDRKDYCQMYAGPACIETFGEKDFSPRSNKEALSLSEEQQKLQVKLQSQMGQIVNTFIPHDQYSFTIIAYPVAEIGKDYETIFQETVRVNNLDKKMYREIQQYLIDALDEAKYVHVVGANGNTTDIRVMLHEKQDPAKETNFENCLADVNIPVGEVFTSPKLTGTEGTLNVSSVFLGGLDYKNLTITFKDGKIESYDCSNFEEAEKNQAFIHENLLHHRDTLPIGEFAIGTNTTAYVMARKYDILHKLPILIVEKMGPHFAVGDTCYSHSEEMRLYNPDGKEIVAKENECSMLRHSDPDKAYFNIHTDITIPYEEIGLIEAIKEDETSISIIENGRFVLPGTEALNLKEME